MVSDGVISANRTKDFAIATEQGGLGNMICTGDLVQDWQGRAGIAVATADPPATDKIRPEVGSHFDDLRIKQRGGRWLSFRELLSTARRRSRIPGEEPAERFCLWRPDDVKTV